MCETFFKIDFNYCNTLAWNLKTSLGYEPAKNPLFNTYCFDAIYPYHYTTEEITQVVRGKYLIW